MTGSYLELIPSAPDVLICKGAVQFTRCGSGAEEAAVTAEIEHIVEI